MGRWPAGHPKAGQPLTQVPPPDPLLNDFNYDYDAEAQLCPFHAHIRRANPRVRVTSADGGVRPPRIVRRGMSYGPPVRSDDDVQTARDALQQERGLVFMAYNASLGEQFEVVQRWLAGGNSSGSYSGKAIPSSVSPNRAGFDISVSSMKARPFAWRSTVRTGCTTNPARSYAWNGAHISLRPPKRRLRRCGIGRRTVIIGRWSRGARKKAKRRSRGCAKSRAGTAKSRRWQRGKRRSRIRIQPRNFTNASIWAAIRYRHGGVLRTPFGVLVADREMVEQVFADPYRNLTITGYLPRMQRSFGILYLGRDAGQEDHAYEQESEACNAAILGLNQPSAFELARTTTETVLQRLVDKAIGYAQADGEANWDLTVDVRELLEPLLAEFSEEWFGLE